MEIDYQQKYLKYKAKYLELKRQIGGEGGKCKYITPARNARAAWVDSKPCNCIQFKIPPNKSNYCGTCGHKLACHINNADTKTCNN
jgi:hypothetical protein